MQIVLPQLDITQEILDKVKAFIAKPRNELATPSLDQFPKYDFGTGFLFESQLFERRIDEMITILNDNIVREESIMRIDDIVTYTDSDDDVISLVTIIFEDNDILILSYNDAGESDTSSTLRMCYYGCNLLFSKILINDLGIDITKALTDRLVPPRPAPDGWDADATFITNLEKVCITCDDFPSELIELAAKLPDIVDKYPLTSEVAELLSFEDRQFTIPDSENGLISYRDSNNENLTYVLIYNRKTHHIVKSMVWQYTSGVDHTLMVNNDHVESLTESIKSELY